MRHSRKLVALTSEEILKTIDDISPVASYVRPKFSVVVVKKRIITRIFSAQGRMDNPPPGTIVDSVITKPEW